MSISFPKTWSSERLDATDVRDNLDAMKNKQQKLGGSDMQTSLSWIDTHHLMEGRYTTTTNMTENISGTFAGKNNGAFTNRTSYCSRWLSEGTSNNTRGMAYTGRTPSITASIDFVTIATLGNGTDYGDLTLAREYPATGSDSHGGLQSS